MLQLFGGHARLVEFSKDKTMLDGPLHVVFEWTMTAKNGGAELRCDHSLPRNTVKITIHSKHSKFAIVAANPLCNGSREARMGDAHHQLATTAQNAGSFLDRACVV